MKWLRYYDSKEPNPRIVTWREIVGLLIGFLILFLNYEPLWDFFNIDR